MMISYPGLSKLKTKPVVYQDVLLASDSGTLEELKELSSKRKAMEESINQSSSVTEAVAREMSGGLTSRCEQGIQKVESYLPLLENLVHHENLNGKNRKVISLISDLKIRWSSALTPLCILPLQGPKFYQVKEIHFDLVMTLCLYAALLREQALAVLSSDLVQSATFFRKSAGVYDCLATLLGTLHWTEERPPEATPTVCSIMRLICLADAQAASARKAEDNGSTGGLLAKLHCGVKELMVEAIDISQGVTKPCKDLSPHFLDFMLSCKMLHELMSYRYFVEGLKGEGNMGIAIGVLRRCLANAKKSTPKEDSWRLVFKRVTGELTQLLKKYEHENEFVWNEKVPSSEELLPSPPAVKIVNPIAYKPQIWERTLVFKM